MSEKGRILDTRPICAHCAEAIENPRDETECEDCGAVLHDGCFDSHDCDETEDDIILDPEEDEDDDEDFEPSSIDGEAEEDEAAD